MPDLELYSVRDQIVQQQSGLNWGFSNGDSSLGDAYIALTKSFFTNNPDFFPVHGSEIRTYWDDGTEIVCLLEGTQSISNVKYPKQISSVGRKSILGRYLRGRLGVSDSHRINMDDLTNYGRNNVTVTKISNDEYSFDFSV